MLNIFKPKSEMIFLLDNGHGEDTPGKRSPASLECHPPILEWEYTRRLTSAIKRNLDTLGIDSKILVPEKHDVSLEERCRRINKIARERGTQKYTADISPHKRSSTQVCRRLGSPYLPWSQHF